MALAARAAVWTAGIGLVACVAASAGCASRRDERPDIDARLETLGELIGPQSTYPARFFQDLHRKAIPIDSIWPK